MVEESEVPSAEKKAEEKKPEKRVQLRDLTAEGAEKNKELRFTKRVHMKWRTEDEETLEGEFTIKRPNIGEQSRIGVIMAELRQDKPLSSIDRATAQLQEWIATCMVCVTKAPPWWDPENMFDDEPLGILYAEVVAFANSFRKVSVGK